jgi:hypothetical protein
MKRVIAATDRRRSGYAFDRQGGIESMTRRKADEIVVDHHLDHAQRTIRVVDRVDKIAELTPPGVFVKRFDYAIDVIDRDPACSASMTQFAMGPRCGVFREKIRDDEIVGLARVDARDMHGISHFVAFLSKDTDWSGRRDR